MQVIVKAREVESFQTRRPMTGSRARKEGVFTQPARRWLAALGLSVLGAVAARGADIVVQEFYLPMPEAQLYAVFDTQADLPDDVNMVSFVSIVVTTSGTVVYYDQWEDGYEADINNPTDVSTRVWGDGDDGNGICPGFASDPFGVPAGTVITYRNDVPVPRVVFNPDLFDGGDRVAATKAVTVSRAGWESDRGGAQASAVEVLSILDHGTSYIAPVGTNVLANGMFSYVDLMVMADQDNTTVVIDADGNGLSPTTQIVNRGPLAGLLIRDISKGATVKADKPVQVHMVTGNVFNGGFETRSYVLRPVELWSSRYVIPLGTVDANYPGIVFLFNTNAAPLSVTYTDRNGSGTLTVPASNGLLAHILPLNSGTLLESVGGVPFASICAMDTSPFDDPDQTPHGGDFDWGFSPMPFGGLTTELVAGRAPGADTNSVFWTGTENGNPIWISALSNTTLYVDFHGDHLGPLTDPDGGGYDTNFVVSALEVTAIYDLITNDQTGMRVYTLDHTLIVGAWGEDPSVAIADPPFLDMGYALVPFPTFTFTKTSRVTFDSSPTNILNVGDEVEYTLRISNKGLLPLGNLLVFDTLPLAQILYLTNTSVLNGSPLPDDDPGIGSPFPVDQPGSTVSINYQEEIVFTYQCRIIGSGSILNYATAAIDEDTELVSTNIIRASTPMSVGNAIVPEGNSGTTGLVFTVTLSNVSTGDVSVAFATSNGTAEAGSDYVATNGTLIIPQGSLTGFIVVQVYGDTDLEPDETLFVTLDGATGDGVIIVGQAMGTIINDDSILIRRVDWTYNPRRDSWFGTLTLSNDIRSAMSLTAPPVWYEVLSNAAHRLRFPTGPDTTTTPEPNWFYLDLSSPFAAAVQNIGNLNPFLDPGETVVVSTNIELWGRGSVSNLSDRVVATNWVSPPVIETRPAAARVALPASAVALPKGPVISGKVTGFGTRAGLAGVTVTLSNKGGTVKTGADGTYAVVVPYGWKGKVTVSLSGGKLTPASRSLTAKVTASKSGLDFTWKSTKK